MSKNTVTEARRLVRSLRKKIDHHRFVYHTRDEEEISDPDYDALFDQLVKLEEEFPELVTPDSPTQQVGGATLSKLPPALHRVPMLSLVNAFTPEDVVKFDERIREALTAQQIEYAVEPKVDGLALSLTYTNGRLTRAATRGDGTVGELVTANLMTVEGVPKQLRGRIPDEVEVRGELYISKKDFERFNEAQRRQGKKLYANARNLAAGSIRQLEADAVAERPLKFFAYSIPESTESPFQTQSLALEWLDDHGVPTIGERAIATGVDELLSYYERIRNARSSLQYMIDGVVYKVNNLESQRQIGFIARAPKFALAHKFPPDRVVTRLERITVSVGRTGALTPVAVLSPVQVGGVTVTSATLHNEEEVNRKRLKAGRDVYLQRAGDVIPEVVGAVDSTELEASERFRIPAVCPACGSQVVRPVGEAVARCTGGLSCPAQLKRTLLHFASRRAMDIEGVGETLVDVAVGELGATGPADLYQLHDLSLRWLAKTRGSSTIQETLRGTGSSDQEFLLFLQASGFAPDTKVSEVFARRDSLDERAQTHLDRIAIASIPRVQPVSGFRRSRLGEKDAIRLQAQLEKSKTRPLHRLVFALGIPHVGEQVAKLLARQVTSLEEFLEQDWGALLKQKESVIKAKGKKAELAAPLSEFQRQYHGIGQEIFLGVGTFLAQSHNVAEIRRLLEAGVKSPVAGGSVGSKGPLSGVTFVFTGRFASVMRADAQRRIEALGGEILNNVSERLRYLVVGDLADPRQSNKRARAIELGKEVLTETKFESMLKKYEN